MIKIEQKQIQVQGIQNFDNSPFMSNQQTIAHEPDKFILDFKNIYPQFTLDNQPTVVINHKVILLDPYGVKEFFRALKENIDKYEKKFGEIKKPEQIMKAEKEIKNIQRQTTTGTETPSYMG